MSLGYSADFRRSRLVFLSTCLVVERGDAFPHVLAAESVARGHAVGERAAFVPVAPRGLQTAAVEGGDALGRQALGDVCGGRALVAEGSSHTAAASTDVTYCRCNHKLPNDNTLRNLFLVGAF